MREPDDPVAFGLAATWAFLVVALFLGWLS